MSEPVRVLLDLFEALPDLDKRSAITEILRRNPPAENDVSLINLDALVDELFANLDAEETDRIILKP